MKDTPESRLPESDGKDDSQDNEVHFVRHGRAQYKTYGDIASSDNPQQPFNPEVQVTTDLTEKGAVEVEIEAKKFIGSLDPEKDALFFVSSNESRAIQTANIYRAEAHKAGVEVIKPQKAGTKFAEAVGDGEIRTVRSLSLNSKNIILNKIFNSPKQPDDINWGAVDPETREKWERARAIIIAGDKGSFGANFFAYSQEVKDIFPEVETSRELYENNFKNLLILVRFAMKKINDLGISKKVHIMAFGHENYLLDFLAERFNEEGIKNCEAINIKTKGDNISVEFRGKEIDLQNTH
jgi:hypothetical protein